MNANWIEVKEKFWSDEQGEKLEEVARSTAFMGMFRRALNAGISNVNEGSYFYSIEFGDMTIIKSENPVAGNIYAYHVEVRARLVIKLTNANGR